VKYGRKERREQLSNDIYDSQMQELLLPRIFVFPLYQYNCGLLLIGPPTSYTGKHASTLAKLIIAIIVLIDLLRLTFWLVKRWFITSLELRQRASEEMV
jgi:hypothetical protein